MKSDGSKQVLILGCSTKAGYFVAKQFSLAGYAVTIYDWRDLPNRYSRYVKNYVISRSPEEDLEEFVNSFVAFLRTHKFLAILPIHDAALEIVRYSRRLLPQDIIILGVNADEIYRFAHNKWQLQQLAERHNILVPETIYISEEGAIPAKNDLKFPIVVKPVSSAVIKDERLYSFKVRIVNNYEELIDIVREHILNVPLMLQEFIDGYGIGYNFIAINGILVNSYIHRRINEHQGISSFREIIDGDTYKNKREIDELIKNSGWTGVGMLEFKVGSFGPVLMELNGRFFGSIELSVKSGINLPLQFIRIFLEKKEPAPVFNFRSGVKVRNLHDEILLNSSLLFKGKFLKFCKWKLDVLKTILSKNEYIEDDLFSDPGFSLGQYLFDGLRNLRKTRDKLRLLTLTHSNTFTFNDRNKKNKIAFVCKGNICRSPFAEAYAKSIDSFHQYCSFGTYFHENRLPPTNAVISADSLGIELQNHRSRYLKRELINSIDKFVVMDKKNYLALREMDIPATKICYLSHQEIADPYGKDLHSFKSAYQIIKKALDRALRP